MNNKSQKNTKKNGEDEKFPLPIYPAGEDIYTREKEETFDENDITVNPEPKVANEKESENTAE